MIRQSFKKREYNRHARDRRGVEIGVNVSECDTEFFRVEGI